MPPTKVSNGWSRRADSRGAVFAGGRGGGAFPQSWRAHLASAAAIRLVILDVDGTMTDGHLYFGPEGEALKLFHVRDGQGIKHLAEAGVRVAVISGRQSRMVDVRCHELGVEHVIQGTHDKVLAFDQLRKRLRIEASETACVGDDSSDVPLMKAVKLAFAVADAHPDAREAADAVTSLGGGDGAVREVCDYLVAARRMPRPAARRSGKKNLS